MTATENLMDQLRKYCKEKGVSLSSVASELGVSRQVLHTWVTGKRKKVSYDNGIAIKKYLKQNS